MNEAQLVGEVAAAFGKASVDGPQKAWFYVLESADRRVIYQTVAVGKAAPESPEVVAELCQAALDAVKHAIAQHDQEKLGNPLYWRRRPTVEHINGVTRLSFRIGVEGFSMIGHHPLLGADL